MDDVVRYGVIATMFWGITGFLVGVLIASQLAWPLLNVEPWFTFGRLRPLHTSAVIFAFGGNALIATSFFIVQRTTRASLWGGDLPWPVTASTAMPVSPSAQPASTSAKASNSPASFAPCASTPATTHGQARP